MIIAEEDDVQVVDHDPERLCMLVMGLPTILGVGTVGPPDRKGVCLRIEQANHASAVSLTPKIAEVLGQQLIEAAQSAREG